MRGHPLPGTDELEAVPGGGHISVLAESVLELLGCVPEGALVDCTLGMGGHAERLLEANARFRLIGLDLDDEHLEACQARLRRFEGRVHYARANFADLPRVLRDLGVLSVTGILADLGVSSVQLGTAERGFSFDRDGPLDMRLDRRQSLTAADLVNGLSEKELSDLLYFQAQERHSRRISKRICEARRQGRIVTTGALARIVASAVGDGMSGRPGGIHPATRTFLALRMAVNREIDALRRLLSVAPAVLSPGGRIVVISFQSTEDRVVKEDFRARCRLGVYRLVTRKPVVAGDAERTANPRSRSAKLRCAERTLARLEADDADSSTPP